MPGGPLKIQFRSATRRTREWSVHRTQPSRAVSVKNERRASYFAGCHSAWRRVGASSSSSPSLHPGTLSCSCGRNRCATSIVAISARKATTLGMRIARLPRDTPYDAHSVEPIARIAKYPIETSRLDRSVSVPPHPSLQVQLRLSRSPWSPPLTGNPIPNRDVRNSICAI